MGIRLHKAIGYGLTDVVTEAGQITDPRINWHSPLLARGDEGPLDDFLAFLGQIAAEGNEWAEFEKEVLASMPGNQDRATEGVCTWDGANGLPNVLVVRPVGFPQWYRYDDPIDYQEESVRSGTRRPRVVPTFGGILPFNESYMDARTGQRVVGKQAETWQRVSMWSPDKDRTLLLERLARQMGYEDHAQASECIVPFVPEEIRRVCAWGGLFTSPEVCFQLRPMIYVYWG